MALRIEPKIIQVFKDGYSWKQFQSDVFAGVIVGIVALPLAIAFAIASGVSPERGLYTAIVAGFASSLFAGSRVQISGPTGAFIVIVFGIVQTHGYQGLAMATFMAGLLLLAMGFAGMGVLLRFIPYPLTVGFTSGIALVIFSSQVADLLGLHADKIPADFVHKWIVYGQSLNTVNIWSVLVSLFTLGVLVFWGRRRSLLPAPLVALALSTVLVQLFNIPVETVQSRFGAVPNTLPSYTPLAFEYATFTKLVSPAITIALLGAIESLLSATVADGMIGTRHRPNMELVAQGIGNLLSPVFGGIPSTGAIARTATNVRSGGRTPIAGLVHAITLVLIMLLFGNLASLIPMAALAAVLTLVAYNMSEWHAFVKTFHAPRADVAVLLVTFFLTVFIDLTVAIEAGVVLSAFMFLKRMESVTSVQVVTEELEGADAEDEESGDDSAIQKRDVPEGVEVFEVYGPLFFAAVERFSDTTRALHEQPRVVILRMRHVPVVDATGIRALEELHRSVHAIGGTLLLSGIQPQPRRTLERAGIVRLVGSDNLCPDIDAALDRARAILAAKTPQ